MNIKKTWQTVKHLIGSDVGRERERSLIVDGREIVDTQQIANELNNFFASIGQKLNEEILIIGTCPLQYVKRNANSFFLSEVTPVEVKKLISNLKLTGTDRDSVSVKLLKHAARILSAPISMLINRSFEAGVFHSILKLAEVVPIFKSGDRKLTTNYTDRYLYYMF